MAGRVTGMLWGGMFVFHSLYDQGRAGNLPQHRAHVPGKILRLVPTLEPEAEDALEFLAVHPPETFPETDIFFENLAHTLDPRFHLGFDVNMCGHHHQAEDTQRLPAAKYKAMVPPSQCPTRKAGYESSYPSKA